MISFITNLSGLKLIIFLVLALVLTKVFAGISSELGETAENFADRLVRTNNLVNTPKSRLFYLLSSLFYFLFLGFCISNWGLFFYSIYRFIIWLF